MLHKRGKGCRDEIGKLEGIGGRFEESDGDFLNALNREIKEEVGEEAQIEVGTFFEVRKDTVRDVKDNKEQHRIIVSYLCKYQGGELTITEPHKNEGFVFVDIHTIDEKTLSSSALSAIQSLRKNQLLRYDPSRHTVYQMLEYALQEKEVKVIRKELPNMFLIKTEPFQYHSFHCVHFFEPVMTEQDMVQIKDFFQGDAHRIHLPRNTASSHFLSEHGYTVKYEDDSMLRQDASQDLSFTLPDYLTLQPVNNTLRKQQHEEIFSITFDKSPQETQQKF